ncbi:MAG: biopolymer transporter ExbD [Boseongicola sp.]|nr:biopolymer transporter ExbD [Boseongicola sp.]NNL17749.1 biopolymer transporter ExbD [Boseongicola sp.]
MSLMLQTMRRRRSMSLTPMIDVVFLLLVFFMLAARFDQTQSLPITLGTAGSDYSGPPRLVDVTPESVLLNGVETEVSALAWALLPLMENTDDIVILRARSDADVQRLVDVMGILRNQGLTALALVE